MTHDIKKSGFVFVTPVWGYIDIFLDLCLPTLLASGNLPSLQIPNVYLIYTTKLGEETIRAHPLFQDLELLMPVEFHLLEVELPDYHMLSPYSIVTICHQKAIYYTDKKDAAIFFIQPDFVFPNGALKNAETIALSGVRVISVPYLRLNLESTAEILFNHKINDRIECNAQKWMEIALNNLHEVTIANIWEEEPGFMLPHILLWKVEEEGLLGRFFYGMPLMIYPRIKNVSLYATVDIHYAYQACPNMEDHYLCQDSDEIVMFDLTSNSRNCVGFPKGSLEHLLYFSEHLNEYQLEHGRHVIQMHTGIKKPDKWLEIQNQSDKICETIYSRRPIPFQSMSLKSRKKNGQ
jgi:hypothetical protein